MQNTGEKREEGPRKIFIKQICTYLSMQTNMKQKTAAIQATMKWNSQEVPQPA